MPSKVNWTLNPRRWFGAIASTTHKRDQNAPINDSAQTSPSLTMNHSVPTTGTLSFVLAGKNKTKVAPAMGKSSKNAADATASFKHYELRAVRTRSDKNSSLLSSSPSRLFYRRTPMGLVAPPINSTGRYAAPSHEQKSTHANRQKTTAVVHDTSEYVFSSSVPCIFPNLNDNRRRNERTKVELPPSPQPPLVKDPSHSSDHPMLRRSSSSICGTNDLSASSTSSTSDICTDERPDLNHRRPSKDTRSTVEVRSIESRPHSRTCLYDEHVRLSRSDRRLSTFSHKSTDFASYDYSQSITRASAASILKKIEKRLPLERLPSISIAQKSTSMRTSNDSHRLYRRRRPRSLARHVHADDWLRSASEEASYANLPRTSSTQQFNHYSSDSLRAMVDTCLRPRSSSRNVREYAETNEKTTEPNVEDITGKLLSSIDCSIYA